MSCSFILRTLKPRQPPLRLQNHRYAFSMPVTRSASGATARAAASKAGITDTSKPPRPAQQAAASTKRKAGTTPKASRKKNQVAAATNATGEPERDETVPKTTRPVLTQSDGDAPALVPAVLTFSFEDAKQHLIATDPRFEDVFRRLKCKPFEHLERIDPFRCAL